MRQAKSFAAGLIVSAVIIALAVFGFRKIGHIDTSGRQDRGSQDKPPLFSASYREVDQIRLPELGQIQAVAVDIDGRLYIAGERTVEIVDRNADASGSGRTRIELDDSPRCLAVDHDGMIFVGMSDHVEVFDRNGTRHDVWPFLADRALITSIALSDRHVFAADAGHHVVWRFSRAGELEGRIDGKGHNQPGFIIPSPYFDVACSGNGMLWIANPGRHRIEQYRFDGTPLGAWGQPARGLEGFQGCCNPSHFAVAADGTFITSEKGLPRVKICSAEGKFLALVADHRLLRAVGTGLDVAVDKSGRVYVADPELPGVRVFDKRGS